jgi:hypothetical protein
MASHSGNSDDRLSKGIAVSGLERYFDNSLFLPCDWPSRAPPSSVERRRRPRPLSFRNRPCGTLHLRTFYPPEFSPPPDQPPEGFVAGFLFLRFTCILSIFCLPSSGLCRNFKASNRSPSESASDEPVREQFPACYKACYSLNSIYRLLFSLHPALFST